MKYAIGDIVTLKEAAITNDVGGTSFLKKQVQAKITKSWKDYEIGERYIGTLLKEEDIQASREAGKTGFTPEDYKKYGEERYQQKVEHLKKYDPSTVYFSDDEVIR